MPPVSRVGDKSTADPCGAAPRPSIAGSGNVLADGIPVVRVGDPYALHKCPGHNPPHPAVASGGSGTVLVNGLPLHRVGDPISCGSVSAAGSGTVISGG